MPSVPASRSAALSGELACWLRAARLSSARRRCDPKSGSRGGTTCSPTILASRTSQLRFRPFRPERRSTVGSPPFTRTLAITPRVQTKVPAAFTRGFRRRAAMPHLSGLSIPPVVPSVRVRVAFRADCPCFKVPACRVGRETPIPASAPWAGCSCRPPAACFGAFSATGAFRTAPRLDFATPRLRRAFRLPTAFADPRPGVRYGVLPLSSVMGEIPKF